MVGTIFHPSHWWPPGDLKQHLVHSTACGLKRNPMCIGHRGPHRLPRLEVGRTLIETGKRHKCRKFIAEFRTTKLDLGTTTIISIIQNQEILRKFGKLLESTRNIDKQLHLWDDRCIKLPNLQCLEAGIGCLPGLWRGLPGLLDPELRRKLASPVGWKVLKASQLQRLPVLEIGCFGRVHKMISCY